MTPSLPRDVSGFADKVLLANDRTCPMCGAAIVDRDDDPLAKDPYVPRTMWICAAGHRIVNPDYHAPRRT